jgi:recombination protein RecA
MAPRTKARAKADGRALRAKLDVPTDIFGGGDDAPAEAPPSRTERDSRLNALAAVAGRFNDSKPPREVLKRVRSVPTCFPGFDHATRVGGYPIERITTVHGPSNAGKTAFALGVLASFLRRDHFARLYDLERTTPVTWLETLMGDVLDHPGFSAARPHTYEEVVDDVRNWCTQIATARTKGEIPPDTTGVMVLDSLRKLVPENFFTKLSKGAEEHGIDGMGGRGAQLKAAYNAAWFDELIPLLDDTGTALLIIARESEEIVKNGRFEQRIVKLGGGGSVVYESSLIVRVERARWITDGEGKEAPVVGEQHRLTIRKTKIGGKDDRVTIASFHTSNGKLTPEGFDTARDVLDLGARLGVVKKSGGWVGWSGKRIQGETAAVRWLADPSHRAHLDALTAEVRDAFDKAGPTEIEEGA